jgi:magnesium-transporting ATPase (P-type)
MFTGLLFILGRIQKLCKIFSNILLTLRNGNVKLSHIDKLLNKIIIYIILLAAVTTIVCTILGFVFWFKGKPNYADDQPNMEYIFYTNSKANDNLVLEVFKIFTAFFTIFNTLIPISIMITLEVVKGLQVVIMDKEPGLRDSPEDKLKILSMRLQEDLGCIKYIFTDKTGTLTRNEMEFKACSIFSRMFDEEKHPDESCIEINRKSIFSKNFDLRPLLEAFLNGTPICLRESPFSSMKHAILEYLLNIAINHNVLTEEDPETKEKCYTGSSPDEVVLVQAAKELGVEFIERVGKSSRVKVFDEIQTFEVLHRFEYSSARMRSSIIIKDSNGVIKLYMKGADTIILKRINEYSQEWLFPTTKEHLEKFAKDGLRTLCYSMKILSPEELTEWEIGYREIHHMAIIDKTRVKDLEQKISDIETNTLLLGVSGLEDKLQDDVKNVLQDFIEAGINCWMLTGDKLDTAESIGYSCRLFNDDTEVFKIKANDNKLKVLEQVKAIIFQMEDVEEEMLMFQITKNTKKRKALRNKLDNFERDDDDNPIAIKRALSPVNRLLVSSPVVQIERHKEKKISLVERKTKFFDDLEYLGAENNPKDRKITLKFKRNDSKKIFPKMDQDDEVSHEIVDDFDIIKYMVDIQFFEENKNNMTLLKKLANEQEDSIIKNNLKNKLKDEVDTEKGFDFGNLYNYYKNQVTNLNKGRSIFDFTFKNNKQIVATNTGNEKDFFLMNFGIIVEGSAISMCLDPDIAPYFWKILRKSRSVICCRCSPLQKAEVVKFIKKKSKAVTLSIGDGGNDINMIKQANVGVGIFGKEGYQAAFNSDYAISQFKFLKNLLFVQGRYHLLRNAYFVYYYFYKNLIFTFPQFWFSLFNGFSGTLLWDDWYYLGYNSFITTIPVSCRMLFEEDIDISFEGANDKEILEWYFKINF